MGMHVVMTGDPANGFAILGPFATRDEALAWAERECDGDWWLLPLVAPDAA